MDGLLGSQYPDTLLSTLGINPEDLRRQQQQAGLLSAGLQLLSQSGYSPVRRTAGELIGQAGMAGVQGMQQAGEGALQRGIQNLQVGELARKQQEAQLLRTLGPQLFTTEDGKQVINQQIANQLMTSPAGMEYVTNLVKAKRELAGKTDLVEIYSPSGQPMKVRYNSDTGEYTPIGGTKAEPFTQIDLGNVVELRTPSGTVVGRLPKGVAPVAPSYTMTDLGVLNTKTGQLQAPTDAQGNPIAMDLTAKASEDERKSAGFLTRMSDATKTINSPLTDAQGKPMLDKNGNPITIASAGSKPELIAETIGGILPNWLGSKEAKNFATTAVRQQYQQAQENWVSANLRAESGAAIGVEEMQKEIKKYFPQVGDSDAVIKQKEQARKVAENAMLQRAGRAVPSGAKRNVTVDY